MPIGPGGTGVTSPESSTGSSVGASRAVYLNETTSYGDPYIPYTNSAFSIVSVTAATTLFQTSPLLVRCNASGGAFTLTLPPTAEVFNGWYHIAKVDSAANSVTIAINASDTWYGDNAAKTLAAQWDSVTLIAVYDAVNSIAGWHVVATT